MTPYAFQHAAAGWILAVVCLIMMLIQQGYNIAIAVVVGRARLRQVEIGTTQTQHGERIATLEQASALTLLNTPKPPGGAVLPQSWEDSAVWRGKGNG